MQPYLERAPIKYVLAAHFHADFVSGNLNLASRAEATIVYGPTAPPGFPAHVARGVSVPNVRVGYSWHKKPEVFASVLNLTDERYATRGSARTDRSTYTPGAPRTVMLGVQYWFVGQ